VNLLQDNTDTETISRNSDASKEVGVEINAEKTKYVYVAAHLCGLVVTVLGYRSGGPGSIPGTTRKKSSGSGTGSTQPRELLDRKVAAPV
jgi:hypothetical protein